ncbi:hypothetical protein [Pseudomonas sp. S09G 359]|uniref:hypothetical protein n=1 Tax=Pseudomonas sp. S09G 359 TaxID=2054919 RepID=UPI002115C3BD|nr:hypothetical protein [Pseudomonas sp. S09G 359]
MKWRTLVEVLTLQPKGVHRSQKQIPTTLYARQFGDNTEDVMLPVSSAMLGPHASRRLSAKGLSFVGGIDEQAAGMIQALGVWPGQVRLGIEDCQWRL